MILRFLCFVTFLAAAPYEVQAASRAKEPGERAFQYCFSCHSVNPEETDLQGPNLFGVVGRPIASKSGFKYSPALMNFAKTNGTWTPELIAKFIQDPPALVPGTLMEQPSGVNDPAMRKLILEYLDQQH